MLKDEDFDRVDLEATQTVDIQDFVDLEEIDPMFFYKPYYLEPQKGGDKAYALLRDSLENSKKVGIAKVVIKTRQYLAGVKPEDGALVLEFMHFADELGRPWKIACPKKGRGRQTRDEHGQIVNRQHELENGILKNTATIIAKRLWK